MAIFTGTGAAESIRPGSVSPSVDADGAPSPGAAADLLIGNGGNDTLDGGGGNDILLGGLGNDWLIWNINGGNDTIDGNDDSDTLQVNGSNAAEVFSITANGARVLLNSVSPIAAAVDVGTTEKFVVNMGGGNDAISMTGNLAALISITVDGGAGNDTILGGNGMDLLFGGDGNDFIDGNQGADTVFLGAGNDIFQWDPGDGNDVVEGQAGTDTLRFNGSNIAERFDVSANGGRVRFSRDIANITQDLNDVEHIELNALGGTDEIVINDLAGTDVTRIDLNLAATLGGTAGDAVFDTLTVYAGTGSNLVSISNTALAARIMVRGADAADAFWIEGMSGEDTIVAAGFEHALQINGGTENDTVSYAGAKAAVTVNLGNPAANEGVAAGHTYISIESVIGTSFDDLLMGSNAAETLDGAGGTDYLFGGAGNDLYLVDNAGDVIIETANQGAADEVRTKVSYTLDAPAHVERLATTNSSGKSGIDLTGNRFGQTIVGNAGANELFGKAGNDRLYGGRGKDTLNGGGDDDTFVFHTKLGKSNVDTIVSFKKADDTIALDNAIFTKFTATGPLKASAFHASTSGDAHDKSDRILYETDTGKLFYDKDGTGSADAVLFAILKGHPSITNADFVIV